MSKGSEVVAAAYLLAYIVSMAIVAVRVSEAWSDDALDRLLTGALIAVGQGVGVPLLMGMLTILNRNSVLVGNLALAGVALWSKRRSTSHADDKQGLDLATRLTVFITAGFFALASMLSLGGRTFDTDSFNYHLPRVADWIRTGTLWHFTFQLPLAWTSAHPSSGELLGAFVALPTHGDQLALLAPVAFALLAVIASAMLARELGGSAWLGTLAGIAVFASPLFYSSQVRSLETDGAAAAGIVTAAALILRGRRTGELRWHFAAGIALGLGLGSKYTAFIPGIVLVIISAVLIRRVKPFLAMIPGVVFFLLPWLIRNWIEAGNPIFPQQVKIGSTVIFKGSDNPFTQYGTSLLHHVLAGHTHVVLRWMWDITKFIGPVALLAVIGMTLAFRRKTSSASNAMGALALISLIAYVATPFTGGGPTGRIFWLEVDIRYVLPALMVGAVVGVTVVSRAIAVGLVAFSLAFDAVLILRGNQLSRDANLHPSAILVVLAFVIGLAFLVASGRRKPVHLRNPAVIAMTTLIVFAGAFGIIHRSNTHYEPSQLETLIARARGDAREVSVIGGLDFRSMIGRHFDVALEAVPVRIAAPDAEAEFLDRAVIGSRPNVLAVSSLPAYGLPTGYVPPPQWCLFGRAEDEAVYIRASRAGSKRGSACA